MGSIFKNFLITIRDTFIKQFLSRELKLLIEAEIDYLLNRLDSKYLSKGEITQSEKRLNKLAQKSKQAKMYIEKLKQEHDIDTKVNKVKNRLF